MDFIPLPTWMKHFKNFNRNIKETLKISIIENKIFTVTNNIQKEYLKKACIFLHVE
jgi:hypothetical protein